MRNASEGMLMNGWVTVDGNACPEGAIFRSGSGEHRDYPVVAGSPPVIGKGGKEQLKNQTA
jgi:hypothetical protein